MRNKSSAGRHQERKPFGCKVFWINAGKCGFDEIGYDAGQTAFSATLEAFANGTADIKTVLELFSEAMPFIPICYTRSALALNLSVKGDVEPSENFIFSKIETWYKS